MRLIPDEVFFRKLHENGYVSKLDWKNTHPETVLYTYSFVCGKCRNPCEHRITIEVIGGIHYVHESDVRVFIRLHELKLV